MGLRRVTSNLFIHSVLHPTNHKLVSTMLQHLWCEDKPRVTLDSQDLPQPRLGESHHLPTYSILCASLQGPHPNGLFVPRLPKGSPETAKVGFLQLCGAITSWSDLRLGWGLKQSYSSHWELSNSVLHSICMHGSRVGNHTRKLGQFLTFCGRELNRQFDSRLFFCHNLCCRF
jgi:hypothetical protein